jgi:hypothetical protein
MILTILLFIALTLLAGYTITAKLLSQSATKNIIVTSATGICVWIISIYLFRLVHIPQHILIYLALFTTTATLVFYRTHKKTITKQTIKHAILYDITQIKNHPYITAFLLVIIIAGSFTFFNGTFKYPYLEDGDPYHHLDAATYVKERLTSVQEAKLIVMYFEPYPFAYSTLMGLLFQTNTDGIWTLKFFNALFLSLGICIFYVFIKEFTKSTTTAVLATGVVVSLPAYLSHFIFAHSLGTSLFGIGLYYITAQYAHHAQQSEQKKYIIPLIVTVSAILCIQAVLGVAFGLFCLTYFGIKTALHGFDKTVFFSLACAVILAISVFWLPMMIIHGGIGSIITSGSAENWWQISVMESSNQSFFTFSDFFFAKPYGGIDTHIGIGVVASILAILGVLFTCSNIYSILSSKIKKMFGKTHTSDNKEYEDSFSIIVLVWWIITLLGVLGNSLPVRLVPLRWWAFFAIASAILIAYAIVQLLNHIKIAELKWIILVAIIVGIIFTSFIPRYHTQTAQWPPHAWVSPGEYSGYEELRKTSFDALFPLCSDDLKIHYAHKLSYLVMPKELEKTYASFKLQAFNATNDELNLFLKDHQLSYIVIDTTCLQKYGLNETNKKVQDLFENGVAKPVWQSQSKEVLLLEVTTQ